MNRLRGSGIVITESAATGGKGRMANVGKGAYSQHRNVDRLTPREQQIWDLYQDNKTPTEIAEALGMKRTSVSRNLSTIREKVMTNG